MKTNKLGYNIYSEDELCDILRSQPDKDISHAYVDFAHSDRLNLDLEFFTAPDGDDVAEHDAKLQTQWLMPAEYKQLDIAAHILDLCRTEVELQRVGQELLEYQARGAMDLLRYLKYLVDVLDAAGIVRGIGRGSSTASYVLYLLDVHKIDSIKYELDIEEFLK